MTPDDANFWLRDDSLVEAKRRQALIDKRRASSRFTILNLLANAMLAVTKGAVGLATGSLAVTADAFNSLADTLYSLVLVVGMRFSLRPADRNHPQGHRAVEPLISLVIGVSIAVVAYQLIVRGVRGIMDPPELSESSWTILVLLVAMAVKLAVAAGARRAASTVHSPVLRAVGTDAAADVLASAAALAGYVGAVLGYPLADPIFSLVVSAFVARTAFEVLWENVGYIVGRSAPPELVARVTEVACEPDMVCAVHDLKAYFRGPELHVSFHLEIDATESLQEVHDLEQRIRLSLLDIPEVDDVAVHLDPVEWPPSGAKPLAG
jgi:cation diffusion facilitator family transporter